jgi:hypothetical protein
MIKLLRYRLSLSRVCYKRRGSTLLDSARISKNCRGVTIFVFPCSTGVLHVARRKTLKPRALEHLIVFSEHRGRNANFKLSPKPERQGER